MAFYPEKRLKVLQRWVGHNSTAFSSVLLAVFVLLLFVVVMFALTSHFN